MDTTLSENWTHSSQAGNDSSLGSERSTSPSLSLASMYRKHYPKDETHTSSQIENCQVTATVSTPRKFKPTYHAVQLAASDRSAKTTTKPMMGHFAKSGVSPKRIVKEFEVSEDALLPVGKLSFIQLALDTWNWFVVVQVLHYLPVILYLAKLLMLLVHREFSFGYINPRWI